MKKTIVLCIIAALLSSGLRAQQAKQKKMLLLQIAALRTYIDYAAKGYKTVKNGLHFISDFKKGEVKLHGDYFTSLFSVHPKIKNYTKVSEIIALHIQIVKMYKSCMEELRGDDLFHGSELDYIERTFKRLLKSCGENADTLLLITSSTKLEMKDDERIERIDSLYKTACEQYAFCEKFSAEVQLLALSKAKEKNDVKQAGVLLGL